MPRCQLFQHAVVCLKEDWDHRTQSGELCECWEVMLLHSCSKAQGSLCKELFFTPPLSLQYCCSNLDRDVLKKAIDEVTCWIAAAEEDDTMVLHDLSGKKQGASLWHLWALRGFITSPEPLGRLLSFAACSVKLLCWERKHLCPSCLHNSLPPSTP